MEDPTYPTNGQANHHRRPNRRVSFAQEPWANESTPLLIDGAEPKDTRPIRQSVLNRARSLSKSSINDNHEQLTLPYYVLQRDEDDEEEDDDPDAAARGVWAIIAVLGVLAVLAFLSYGHFHLTDPEIPVFPHRNYVGATGDHGPNRKVLVQAKHGAVATENEICSKMGVDTLKQGGNAADAAVSSTLCVGVINMFSSGIGGGGVLTIRIPPKSPGTPSEVYAIDFREMAPSGSNATMFESNPLSSMFGGLSVGVPGELKGLAKLHSTWGKLPWKQVVEPAAELAKGWRVQAELARRIRMHDIIMLYPDWQPIFAPAKRLLQEGDIISRPALARTLQTIAENGAEAFYKGPIAEALLDKIHETGGIMVQEDFDKYEVRVTKALSGTYRNRTVYTTHAPTSGMVLLHMLNLVEGFENFVESGRTALNTHRIVEAMKFGFAARTRVSDELNKADTRRMAEISSKEYANLIRKNITNDRTHPPDYYNPSYDVKPDHGTSHGSIIDKDGMAVSITSSINLVFGSAVLDSKTGIILNDQMDDFSKPGQPNYFGLWPSPYNYPSSGKRPLSSTCPVIIEDADGDVEMVVGGAGGSRIFAAIFQTILGYDWGLDISQAIEFGRVHDQLFPRFVDVDDNYPVDEIQGLEERGHFVKIMDKWRITSAVQGITFRNGTIFASSDSRKNGIAAGY